MLDTLRKLFLVGLGALELTAENMRSAFDELVRRGELTEKEARDLASDWMKRAGEQRAALQRQVDETIKQQLGRLEVAFRTDLDAVASRLAALEAKVDQLAGSAPSSDHP